MKHGMNENKVWDFVIAQGLNAVSIAKTIVLWVVISFFSTLVLAMSMAMSMTGDMAKHASDAMNMTVSTVGIIVLNMALLTLAVLMVKMFIVGDTSFYTITRYLNRFVMLVSVVCGIIALKIPLDEAQIESVFVKFFWWYVAYLGLMVAKRLYFKFLPERLIETEELVTNVSQIKYSWLMCDTEDDTENDVKMTPELIRSWSSDNDDKTAETNWYGKHDKITVGDMSGFAGTVGITPDAPEVDVPEVPEAVVTETEAPETEAPETEAPEAVVTETVVDETEASETEVDEVDEVDETEVEVDEVDETEVPEVDEVDEVAIPVISGMLGTSKNVLDVEPVAFMRTPMPVLPRFIPIVPVRKLPTKVKPLTLFVDKMLPTNDVTTLVYPYTEAHVVGDGQVMADELDIVSSDEIADDGTDADDSSDLDSDKCGSDK